MMLSAPRESRALPVRAILFAMTVIAGLPALVFAAILFGQYAQSERVRAEELLEQSAKGVARAIDAEFSATEAALRTLSGSVLLDSPDFGEFEQRLRRNAVETGRDIALIERNGQHVVNTLLPRGATLPRGDPNLWEPVFAERRAHVTDVVKSVERGDWIAGVGVPVIRDGEVQWALVSRLGQKEFAHVLAAPGVPPDWIVSIVDRNGIHLARSRRSEEYGGHPVVAPLVAHLTAGKMGVLRTISLEGIPLISTVGYAPQSAWAAAIGFPIERFEAPLRAAVIKFLAVGLAILTGALLLVFLLGRHLNRGLQGLSDAAEKIGEGHAVSPPRSRVLEIDKVGKVLDQVSGKLQAATEHLESQVTARTAQLSQANDRLVEEMRRRTDSEAQVRQLQKIEAIGQLTGGIAHDFNNMMAIILASLRLLRRRLDRGETNLQKYIDAATEGAERAANLTSRLLAFSRQQPLAPEVLDVGKVVTGMSEILRRTIPENIEIETVLAGGLWRANVDRPGLESVIVNLAVNARDAMPDGGMLTIETANAHLDDSYSADNPEAAPGQYVMIAITDTGAGMTPEVFTKAFDPFYTTKGPGEGTGLGLSQVHGFIKQSGGHVKLYSELGQGTTVKLYLRRHLGESLAQASAEPDAASLSGSGNGEKILVVEDEPQVRHLTVEMVEELGYVVIDASGGREALRMLEAHPDVALVITDVVMPGMNGRQLADEIKKRRPELPVLFTTGYTRNAIVHGGVLDPGVHLVTKPHTIEMLAAKIVLLLRRGSRAGQPA